MSDNDSQRDPQQDSWNQVSWSSTPDTSSNSNDSTTGSDASADQQAQAGQDASQQPTKPLYVASDAQPTEPINATQPTQPIQTIPDPAPDYGAASQRPAESTGYRLAPGYGAYDYGYSDPNAGMSGANGQNTGYTTPGYQNPQAPQANDAANAGYAANVNAGQPGFGADGGNAGNAGNGPQQPFPQQPPAAQTKKNGASPVLTAVIAAIVAVALSLAIGFAAVEHGWIKVGSTSTSTTSLKSSTGTDTGSSTQVADGSDWVTVAKNVSNSVVSILVTTNEGSARGSGAILDTDGHVVTNNHVVSGASKIYVTLSDGSMYESTVVGTDATTDLAVLKMNTVPDGLSPITFADSDSLAVGEGVMAIGNPLVLSNTTDRKSVV